MAPFTTLDAAEIYSLQQLFWSPGFSYQVPGVRRPHHL